VASHATAEQSVEAQRAGPGTDNCCEQSVTTVESGGESLPAQVLHHAERPALGGDLDAVHARDVLVDDTGRGARFTLEAGGDVGLVAQGGEEGDFSATDRSSRRSWAASTQPCPLAEGVGDLVAVEDDVAVLVVVQACPVVR
jgi:hypothetical protein